MTHFFWSVPAMAQFKTKPNYGPVEASAINDPVLDQFYFGLA